MNKGSIYARSNVKVVSDISLERGTINEFHEAYKKFWKKRGIDISENITDLPVHRNLSDPIEGDPVRLRKAIEYGRSYRKDKE